VCASISIRSTCLSVKAILEDEAVNSSVRAMRRKFAALFFLAAIAMAAAGAVRASSIAAPFPSTSLQTQASTILLNGSNTLVERSGLVTGAESVVLPISVNTAGTFTVRLADPAWPTRLASLSFAATTSSSVLARMTGPGVGTFEVNGPMTLYATVYANATAPLALGLYSLQVSFAPVPLPGALALLFSGLAGFGFVARRKATLPTA
jgi:hypothetical protein